MPTPSTPPTPAQATETWTSSHRWPWRRQEIGSIVFLALLGPTLGFLGGGWWWTAVAAGLGSAYWLYRIGEGRKAKSAVQIVFDGEAVKVHSRGALGDSRVRLHEVERIDTRRFGSDETFILSGSSGGSARIPLRALRDQEVVDLLATAVTRAAVSNDARSLLASDDLALRVAA